MKTESSFKKLILLITLLLFWYANANAQQVTLRGQVLEINSGREPIAMVEVKSTDGANKVLSNTNGDYQLTFQDQVSGAFVSVEALKQGYELVNEDAMELFLPNSKETKEKRLEIILCKAGYLDQARTKYYKISKEYINSNFNKLINEINAKKEKGWQAQIAKLYEEKARLQKQLKKQAEEYIRTNRDDLSEKELKARELFEAGKLDESLKIRESINSKEELKKELENKNRAEKNIAKATEEELKANNAVDIHRRNLKAEADGYIFKFKFDKAEKKLRSLATIDSLNFKSIYKYAKFLQNRAKDDKAINYFQKVLKIFNAKYGENSNLNFEADLFMHLGISFYNLSNFKEGKKNLENALVKKNIYYSKMYSASSEVTFKIQSTKIEEINKHLFDVYTKTKDYNKAKSILDNSKATYDSTYGGRYDILYLYYAELEILQKKYKKAFDYLSKSKNFRKKLPRQKYTDSTKKSYHLVYDESDGSEYDLKYFYFLGIVSDHLNMFKQSEDAHLKALSLVEKFNLNYYTSNKSFKASIINSLGLLYLKNEKYNKAEKHLLNSIVIFDSEVSINPERFLETLEMPIRNLIRLYTEVKDFDKLETTYLKLIGLKRKYDSENLSNVQNKLGIIFKKQKKYTKAEDIFLKAYENEVTQKKQKNLNTDLTAIRKNIGEFYINNRESLIDNLSFDGFNIYIYSKYTQNIPKYSLSLINLNDLYTDISKGQDNINNLLEIINIISKISTELGNEDWKIRVLLADHYYKLAELYRKNKKYKNAEINAINSINIYQSLPKKSFKEIEEVNALSKILLANIYFDQDFLETAFVNYEDALIIYKRLVELNPKKHKFSLARFQSFLGKSYSNQNKYKLSIESYKSSIDLYRSLSKENSEKYNYYLAKNLSKYALIQAELKNYIDAVHIFSESLTIRKGLKNKDLEKNRVDLAFTYRDLAITYYFLNEKVVALVYFQKAFDMLNRLAYDNKIFKDDLSNTQQNIIGLYKKLDKNEEFVKTFIDVLKKYKVLNSLEQEEEIAIKANAFHTVGNIYMGFKRNNLALKNYAESKLLYKQLMVNNSDIYSFHFIQVTYDEIQTLKIYKNTLDYDQRISVQTDQIKKYKELLKSRYDERLSIANELGSLAFYQLFAKDFKGAEQSAKEALNPTFTKPTNYDAKVEWVNTNLALALLYQGKYEEAKTIYVKLKDKPYSKATYKETFLADLKELEEKGITHPDISKIRKLLKDE